MVALFAVLRCTTVRVGGRVSYGLIRSAEAILGFSVIRAIDRTLWGYVARGAFGVFFRYSWRKMTMALTAHAPRPTADLMGDQVVAVR